MIVQLPRPRWRQMRRLTFGALGAMLSACGGADSKPDSPSIADDYAVTIPGADTLPTGTPVAPRPPLSPPRDADQEFLRRMLDHQEILRELVHAEMMEPAGHATHGAANDPGRIDVILDSEAETMLRALEELYGERFSPRPPAHREGRSVPGSAAPVAGAAGAHAASPSEHHDLSGALREGLAIISAFSPRLTRDRVRVIARSLRASHVALLETQAAP